jgi:hypothetical protein
MLHSGGEASMVISWAVMLATPSGVVDGAQIPPQLAWRVSHHWQVAVIAASIAGLWPRIHEWKIGVASIRLHEQRRHQRRTRRWMERRGRSILDSGM